MELKPNIKYKVTINVGQQVFTYKGFVISSDNNFLTLQDEKDGMITLSINQIIYLQPIGGGAV